MKILDESWSMNFLDDNYKLTNNLDEKFDRVKCMDGTDSKIVMSNENHVYMDEICKKDEIFGWMRNKKKLDETSNWLSVWMKVIPKQLWQMEITGLT